MKVVILHDAVDVGARADERDVLEQIGVVRPALAALGHEVDVVPLPPDLAGLADALRSRCPDLVFNLVESVGGDGARLHEPAQVIEALGLPLTGASAAALRRTTDKLATKAALVAAGLPTPPWIDAGGRAHGDAAGVGRWIVKPVAEDASVGIDDASVIDGPPTAALSARGGFAEAFVEGREFNVSTLARPAGALSRGVVVLPPAEIRFDAFPPGKPRIVGYDAKWSPESFEYASTPRSFDFAPQDGPLLDRCAGLALSACALFGLDSYARVDLRVDEAGAPFVIEVNANPCLSPDAGFLAAALRAGFTARDVVARIVGAAVPDSRRAEA